MELKHHHGAFSVPDLDDAIAWWSRMLGFELERRFPIPQIPADVAMLKKDEMRIELFQVDGAAQMSDQRRSPNLDVRTHGAKHVAFAVPDVRAAETRLKALGADIVFVLEADFGMNMFIRDNAGNLIELVQQPDMWAR